MKCITKVGNCVLLVVYFDNQCILCLPRIRKWCHCSSILCVHPNIIYSTIYCMFSQFWLIKPNHWIKLIILECVHHARQGCAFSCVLLCIYTQLNYCLTSAIAAYCWMVGICSQEQSYWQVGLQCSVQWLSVQWMCSVELMHILAFFQ